MAAHTNIAKLKHQKCLHLSRTNTFQSQWKWPAAYTDSDSPCLTSSHHHQPVRGIRSMWSIVSEWINKSKWKICKNVEAFSIASRDHRSSSNTDLPIHDTILIDIHTFHTVRARRCLHFRWPVVVVVVVVCIIAASPSLYLRSLSIIVRHRGWEGFGFNVCLQKSNAKRKFLKYFPLPCVGAWEMYRFAQEEHWINILNSKNAIKCLLYYKIRLIKIFL